MQIGFLICFVEFTSNNVFVVCLYSGVRILFPLWGGENPTLGGYLFYNFCTTLRLQICICVRVCTYDVRDHHSRYSTYNRMVRKCCLRIKYRYAYPKVYDQAPPLNGSDWEFWLIPGSVEVQHTRFRSATGHDLDMTWSSPRFPLEVHVSFVHYVVMLPHLSSLLRSTPWKTFLKKTSMSCIH